jgi:SnoaL-like domain
LFLGTDASERWTVDEFRAYAHPHFAAGEGWTYRVTERHLDVSPDGAHAWFDELLENDGLGTCRGSGVLRWRAGRWWVVQYNLTIPVPNELAADLAERIRAQQSGGE